MPINPIIIIPAFNVENKIQVVLKALPRDNVIAINDGSRDSTGEVIERNGFKCINIERNQGVGNTLKVGIEYGINNNYSHAITIDADGQHEASIWLEFKKQLYLNDFVVGNRFWDISKVPNQKLSSNFFASLLTFEIFNKKIKDISCGYRGFKLEKSVKYKDFSMSYGFLFESLFNNINDVGSVDIPCIYDYMELLSTRTSELLGFLEAIQVFAYGSKYEKLILELISSIFKRKDIRFSICGYEFCAFYLDASETYIFQTDINKLKEYYDEQQ